MSNRRNHLALERDLEPVVFAIRQDLVSRDKPIEHAFFVETGFGLEIAVAEGGNRFEVGLISRLLGHSPHRTFIQAGRGQQVENAARAQGSGDIRAGGLSEEC